MLGKTAGGLFWMFRYLERCENTARLLDAGWRLALTRSGDSEGEWESVINTAGFRFIYDEKHTDFEAGHVINFLLRDRDNPSSVLSAISLARSNARLVRTALSSEVWEAINEYWMSIKTVLARPVTEKNLAVVLSEIRNRTAIVRGTLHGTMLRNDIYNFCRLGTFVERSDNTARILDVKYYVLLPSSSFVGSSMDNTQWENILRSVSAERSFGWLYGGEVSASTIADFLILDRRMPRSLAFCHAKILENLEHLESEYGERQPCQDLSEKCAARYRNRKVYEIFEDGLHEFLETAIQDTAQLAAQIEQDFRFYG
ncbi:alpha-E domain-containing protein [Thalassovita sp.]|uniref:alpha-E domain-containing protein n=1 Tax=Thalassovita sp. TaxID=1979401 RepID=UPI00288192A1|nr:alpha-E domain-containing protein [Thalassovita sp.]MDF1801930.1 alpha-E domain-containing protein [Thalassovita sp.]